MAVTDSEAPPLVKASLSGQKRIPERSFLRKILFSPRWQLLTVRLLPQKRLPGVVEKKGSGTFLPEENIVLTRRQLLPVSFHPGGSYRQ